MRHTFIRSALFSALAAGVVSCAPGGDLPPLPPMEQSVYRLGPGDQLRIITYGEEQLTGDFKVDDSGKLEIPLLGSVQAGGLTVPELQAEMTNSLHSKNLLQSPSVSVEISTYRPIFILGEVSRPGPYPYQPHMTVLTAAAVAGGFTYRAVQSYASITRDEGHGAVEGKVGRETPVAPGDVITVFERRF